MTVQVRIPQSLVLRLVEETRRTGTERMGLVLGRRVRERAFALELVNASARDRAGRFGLSRTVLDRVAGELRAGARKGTILGYYHSHPKRAICLSRRDVAIHAALLPHADPVLALLLEPHKAFVNVFSIDRRRKVRRFALARMSKTPGAGPPVAVFEQATAARPGPGETHNV